MFRMAVHFHRHGDADVPGEFQNKGAPSKDGLMFSLGIDSIGSLITESMFYQCIMTQLVLSVSFG